MLIWHVLFPQDPNDLLLDSLREMEYSQLYQNIEKEDDSLKRYQYLWAFLQKAKKNNDSDKIVNGYKNFLHYSPVRLRLTYADSMLIAAKKSLDTNLLASTYLTKGIVFYGMKKYQKALTFYLKADSLAAGADAPDYLLYKIKYNIGQIKYYLGSYKKALRLLNDCLKYFKDRYDRPYLNTLHSIGLCYSRLGDYQRSNSFNQLGLTTGQHIGNTNMQPYFIHSKGVNDYYTASYDSAVFRLQKVLPAIEKNNDFANVTLGKYYLGMSLWELDRKREAVSYFLDIDHIFQQKDYIKPEFQNAYKLLVDYYAMHRDVELQFFYTNRLITVDSVIHARYKSLSSMVHNDYSMAKLQSENEALELKWLKLKQGGVIWKAVVVLLLGFILWWGMRSSGIYTKMFKVLGSSSEQETHNPTLEKKGEPGLSIPHQTKNAILERLASFESNKEYLDDISLGKMAIKFDTNSKYLSKVIHNTKGKAFSNYINDLKIDALLEMLKTDKKARKYSNKALAKMVGLGTITRLTRAFKARTQTTVSNYIKQLEDQDHKSSVI